MTKLLGLFVLIFLVSSCSLKRGVMKVSPEAAGDMPDKAMNCDFYNITIADVIGPDTSKHNPVDTIKNNDTLYVSWNLHTPDNLPNEILQFDTSYNHIVQNTDEIWDSNGDASAKFKDWVTIKPGRWQLWIDAVNNFGMARSNRMDFSVVGSLPVKVFIIFN